MKLARLTCCALLLFLFGCGAARSNTTAAFDEAPPRSVAVVAPSHDLGSNAPLSHVVEVLERELVERGWTLTTQEEADALLEPSIRHLNYRAGGRGASATIEARLLRRADGALLWNDAGLGTDESTEEPESESLLDSATGWIVGEATESLLDQAGLSTREVQLQQAAEDAALSALYTFPSPPQD